MVFHLRFCPANRTRGINYERKSLSFVQFSKIENYDWEYDTGLSFQKL
jgi:hypothetical protein